MLFTYDFIRETFNRFNQEIFNGELPGVVFLFSSSRRAAGKYEYRANRLTGKTLPESRIMRFSKYVDEERTVLEDIVLHEMIHLCIESRRIRDSRAHGVAFCSLMEKINARHNRNVTLKYHGTHDGSGSEAANSDMGRRLAFCLMRQRNGKLALLPTTLQGMFELWTKGPRSFDAMRYRWYMTRHSCFAVFRRSADGRRAYIVEDDFWKAHRQYACAVTMEGNAVRKDPAYQTPEGEELDI